MSPKLRRLTAENLPAACLQITPGQKVGEHQIFKVCPSGFGLPAWKEGKARIAPIEFRRLDEPAGPVYRVSGKAYDLIARLH